MGRFVLLLVAVGYTAALLFTVLAITAVGDAMTLRHPLYTLFVAAGVVLACAVLRWPPSTRHGRRPSSIGSVRAPRPRMAEPLRWRPSPYPALAAVTETTQVLPGAVKAAAWQAARGRAVKAAARQAARGRAVVAPQPVAVEDEPGPPISEGLDLIADAYERGHRDGEFNGFNRGVMSVQDPSEPNDTDGDHTGER